MSTLAMALAAAMVPGSAPEKVSGEVRQSLDLRGDWSGTLRDSKGNHRVEMLFIPNAGGMVCGFPGDSSRRPAVWIFHEVGEGKVSIEYPNGERHLALYRQNAGHVRLCIRKDGQVPTSFRVDRYQSLLTLYRLGK